MPVIKTIAAAAGAVGVEIARPDKAARSPDPRRRARPEMRPSWMRQAGHAGAPAAGARVFGQHGEQRLGPRGPSPASDRASRPRSRERSSDDPPGSPTARSKSPSSRRWAALAWVTNGASDLVLQCCRSGRVLGARTARPGRLQPAGKRDHLRPLRRKARRQLGRSPIQPAG